MTVPASHRLDGRVEEDVHLFLCDGGVPLEPRQRVRLLEPLHGALVEAQVEGVLAHVETVLRRELCKVREESAEAQREERTLGCNKSRRTPIKSFVRDETLKDTEEKKDTHEEARKLAGVRLFKGRECRVRGEKNLEEKIPRRGTDTLET